MEISDLVEHIASIISEKTSDTKAKWVLLKRRPIHDHDVATLIGTGLAMSYELDIGYYIQNKDIIFSIFGPHSIFIGERNFSIFNFNIEKCVNFVTELNNGIEVFEKTNYVSHGIGPFGVNDLRSILRSKNLINPLYALWRLPLGK